MSKLESSDHSSISLGVLAILAAGASFGLMNIGAKVVGKAMSPMAAVLVRSAATFVIMLPVVIGSRTSIIGAQPSILFFRGLIGSLALVCSFFSLKYLPAADATLLNQTSALFVMVLAPLCLGERVTRGMVLASLVGFLGVLLVVKPWADFFRAPALIGLLGGFLAAIVMLILRSARSLYPPRVIVLHFAFWGVLLACAGGGISDLTIPSSEIFPWILVLGLFGTSGQLLMTTAYHYAPASIVAPLSLMGVVFAGVFEWLLYGVVPDSLSILGGVLILTGVGAVPYLGRKAPPQGKG